MLKTMALHQASLGPFGRESWSLLLKSVDNAKRVAMDCGLGRPLRAQMIDTTTQVLGDGGRTSTGRCR